MQADILGLAVGFPATSVHCDRSAGTKQKKITENGPRGI